MSSSHNSENSDLMSRTLDSPKTGLTIAHLDNLIWTFTENIEEVLVNFADRHRIKCFIAKGLSCVTCGITADKIILSYEPGLDRANLPPSKGIHVDLFAGNVMMTVDHIKPKSKGGRNVLSNYQPMCYPCNQRKADKYEQEEEP